MTNWLERLRARNPAWHPLTDAAVAALEAALNLHFPAAYKAVLTAIGYPSWPVDFGAPSPPVFGALVGFASDGGEVQYCFAGAAPAEARVVELDLEELPTDFGELPAEPFEDWLVAEMDRADEDDDQRFRDALDTAISKHSRGAPYVPSAAEVKEVAAREGLSLPPGYVWFATTIGSTAWPLEIVDAGEIPALTAAARRAGAEVPAGAGVFGADGGAYYYFAADGGVVSSAAPDAPRASFLAFLRAQVDAREKAPPKAKAPAGPVVRRRR